MARAAGVKRVIDARWDNRFYYQFDYYHMHKNFDIFGLGRRPPILPGVVYEFTWVHSLLMGSALFGLSLSLTSASSISISFQLAIAVVVAVIATLFWWKPKSVSLLNTAHVTIRESGKEITESLEHFYIYVEDFVPVESFVNCYTVSLVRKGGENLRVPIYSGCGLSKVRDFIDSIQSQLTQPLPLEFETENIRNRFIKLKSKLDAV